MSFSKTSHRKRLGRSVRVLDHCELSTDGGVAIEFNQDSLGFWRSIFSEWFHLTHSMQGGGQTANRESTDGGRAECSQSGFKLKTVANSHVSGVNKPSA